MNIFDKLDAIRSKVDASTIEPIFSDEVDSRNSRYENTVETEKNNLLRVMAVLIAFSNNAPSDAVGYMVENGVFERVFCSFDLDKVANLNTDEIITTDWNNIKSIRFKKKVDAIVRCAKLLKVIEGSGFQVDKFKQTSYIPSPWHANHAFTFLVDSIMLSSGVTEGRMFF